jgi:hypothetical protein
LESKICDQCNQVILVDIKQSTGGQQKPNHSSVQKILMSISNEQVLKFILFIGGHIVFLCCLAMFFYGLKGGGPYEDYMVRDDENLENFYLYFSLFIIILYIYNLYVVISEEGYFGYKLATIWNSLLLLIFILIHEVFFSSIAIDLNKVEDDVIPFFYFYIGYMMIFVASLLIYIRRKMVIL